jgi:putative flippase GtrA
MSRVSVMSLARLPDSAEADRAVDDLHTQIDVEIVIPVYNEADQLEVSITALHSFLHASFPLVTTITIADNASTDDTWRIATGLADALDGVDALHLDEKGRGRALRTAWSNSTATVVAYMDVDLATGLEALLPLVAPLLSGHSDLAIGTRLAPGSHVVRGARREFISRGYNLLLRSTLRTSCSDAQCGFKALRRQVAVELLPLVEDDEWFFDTEVLVTAQRLGLRIHEVPVDWVDDTDSRVQVVHTAVQDLRGVWRMLGPESRHRAGLRPDRAAPDTERDGAPTDLILVAREDDYPVPGSLSTGPVDGDPTTPAVSADELLRFAGVGVASTAAYAALFAALEPALGSYGANTVAIGLCSLANTAAHRGMVGAERYDHDRTHRMTVAAGLLGVSLASTTAALAAVRSLGLDSRTAQLAAVTSANSVAAVIRFGILRTWVFRPHYGSRLQTSTAQSTASALSTTSRLRARTPQ